MWEISGKSDLKKACCVCVCVCTVAVHLPAVILSFDKLHTSPPPTIEGASAPTNRAGIYLAAYRSLQLTVVLCLSRLR